MAINYNVRAKVIDITSDTPKAEDIFLVDTNVWYWMTYPNASSHTQNQLSDYPSYLNNALSASAKIYHSSLTLAELAHIIERTEREIYEKTTRRVLKPKEYRHNLPDQRSHVVSQVQTAWAQVSSLAEPMTVTVDTPTTTAALNCLQTDKVDGYDLFILESMRRYGVVQVITDDGDFATVHGIEVFTANRNVIQTSITQGQFLTRS